MVVDHLLLIIEPKSALEWTCTSFQQYLAVFYAILLEELQVALLMLELGMCSSL